MDETTTVGGYTDAALMELAQRAGVLVCAADDLIEECVQSPEPFKRVLAREAQVAADDLRAFLSSLHGLGFMR